MSDYTLSLKDLGSLSCVPELDIIPAPESLQSLRDTFNRHKAEAAAAEAAAAEAAAAEAAALFPLCAVLFSVSFPLVLVSSDLRLIRFQLTLGTSQP
ncbi:hypothetical protein BGX31_001187 [Mortierella sp. GBA43]|nr:hypothetical protein BGX31_001187 [Mortierella sp. GBA43]